MKMQPLIVGAVAYDAKVIPIWEGIREYYRGAPVEMDVVWFSNYEAQVEALLAGFVEVAWNTNLAYARTHHATSGTCRVLAMRDTDVGFTTLLVGRAGELTDQHDLKGRTLAIGSADSAQAAIMPTFYLAGAGLRAGEDFELLRFDTDVGKHGDTGTSELEVLRALREGQADAGFLGHATWEIQVAKGAKYDPKLVPNLPENKKPPEKK